MKIDWYRFSLFLVQIIIGLSVYSFHQSLENLNRVINVHLSAHEKRLDKLESKGH